MKPSFEQISYSNCESFKVEYLKFPYFNAPWHFHPEYELTYIIESSGRRYVGDKTTHFEAGDLVLVGPNLPHVWLNDERFYEDENKLDAKAIVIQFQEHHFPYKLLELPEFQCIKTCLKKAINGISIHGKTQKKITSTLLKMDDLSGMDRYSALLKMLDAIGKSNETESLASNCYTENLQVNIPARLKKVIFYINENYKFKIRVEDVADIAAMNKSAFCRYFKEKTGKTFSQYVNEFRINYACKLLMENHFNIAQTGFECGFNNLSNFNRQFKSIIGKTPHEYKSEYIELN